MGGICSSGGKVQEIRSGLGIASPGQPDASVIAMLEDFLQRAKDGEVISACIVVENADASISNGRAGTGRARFNVAGGLLAEAMSLVQED